MINEIKVAITPEAITNLSRQAKLFELIFVENLEIILKVKSCAIDENGEPIYLRAVSDPNLSESERTIIQSKYWPIVTDHKTDGSRVDANGAIVNEGGVMSEKEYLQGITIGQVKAMFALNDDGSFLEALFQFIEVKIQDMVNRRKI